MDAPISIPANLSLVWLFIPRPAALRSGLNCMLLTDLSAATSDVFAVDRTRDLPCAAAGKFTYGIMAASALTFGFWRFFGARAFPRALELGPRGGLIQCLQW